MIDSARRPRWQRWLAWTALIIALVFVGLIVFIETFNWNRARPFIAAQTKERLGRELRIDGDLQVKILRLCPYLSAEQVTFENAAWSPGPSHMVDLGEIKAGVCLLPLLRRQVDVTQLQLRHARVHLAANQDGVWNFAVGDAATVPPDEDRQAQAESEESSWPLPEWRDVDLADVRVTIVPTPAAAAQVLVVDHLSSRRAAGSPLSVDAGGSFRGLPFGIDADLGVPDQSDQPDQPDQLDTSRPATATAKAFFGSAKLNAVGEMPVLDDLTQLAVDFEASAKDLSSLAAAFDLPLSADVPAFNARGKLTREGSVYRIRDLSARLGGSDIAGDLQASLGRRPAFDVNVRMKVLRWDDIAPLMPKAAARELPGARSRRALPSATPAPATDKEPAGRPRRVFSPTLLPLDALNKVDVKADIAIATFEGRGKAAMIEGARLSATLKDGVLDVKPAKLDFAGSHAELVLRLAAQRRPYQASLDLAVTNMQLARFLAPYLPETKVGKVKVEEVLTGGADTRLKLETSGSSIQEAMGNLDGTWGLVVKDGRASMLAVEVLGLDFTEALGTLLAKQQTMKLDCGIMELEAKQGVIRPQPFLIGTPDSNIVVTGSIDLRQEQLDLTIASKPKDFSLGSLRTPIDIKGSFLEPKVRPRTDEIAGRVAAAVGLGFAVGPLASVLPFIEPGTEKAGRCQRYIEALQGIAASAKAAGDVSH